MNRLAQLLGSSTRAKIVTVLALVGTPLSAYRVSKMYNMNIAKVYIEMKKLANLGLVSATKGSRGFEYALTDGSLRTLALKLSPRIVAYDNWRSAEAKAQRFRSGLIKAPKFSLGRQTKPLDTKPTRMPGELSALALLARSKFDKKYRRISDRRYVRV
jgi:hypothetical protein